MAHVYLGREAVKARDYGKALLLAKRAERLNPEPEDIFYIGDLYHQLREYDCAIAAYLRAINLGSTNKALLFAGLAACYISLGELAEAKKYGEWALRCDPDDDYVREVWEEYEKARIGGPSAE